MRSPNSNNDSPSTHGENDDSTNQEPRGQGLTSEPREATISEYRNQALGICLVLTIRDLRALGLNVTETSTVQYWIEANQLRIASHTE
jgi:hypothetical protein